MNNNSSDIIKAISFDEDIIGKKSVHFSVEGEPFAKQRPRAARKGRFITIYTPKPTKDYESKVRKCYNKVYDNDYYKQDKLTGPLIAKIEAVFVPPKSATKKQRDLLLSEKVHTSKPDCDNIGKVCLDALNGVVYEDDSTIDTLLISKKYGLEEKVNITIYERSKGDKERYDNDE